MKTKLTLLGVAALITVACDHESGNPTTDDAETSGHLLITELPPELIEGTPRPIHIPGASPGQVSPARTSSPGTDGVMYVPRAAVRPKPAKVGAPASARQPLVTPRPDDPGLHYPAVGSAVDHERYDLLVDNRWQTPEQAPLSTFSVDVDTASYANVRRMILDGSPVRRDAVRLEELVNYFDYAYPQPADGHPFAVHVRNAACPWNPGHQLVRVALKGREVNRMERAPANLVFLLDVSGSMQDSRKLPLVVESLNLLLEELDESDTLAIVVYASAQGVALPPTHCDSEGRQVVSNALRNLNAGGSTNGGAGIKLAYQLAREQFKPGGINRVILATDGDFNVGVTSQQELVDLVATHAKSKVDLTVMSVGTGNLNDSMLEAITNHGNGTHHYIDSLAEARRVFLDKMMGTLVTIARDVKIQVEFNPARVRSYRLLGYANRMLHKEDFNNDRVDAGEIGSGHTVTAFYEIETTGPGGDARVDPLRYAGPVPTGIPGNPEWLTVKLRYKQPDSDRSTLVEHPYIGVPRSLAEADADFRFATSVAMTAMALRGSGELGTRGYWDAEAIAQEALGSDPDGRRAEFVQLLEMLSARSAYVGQ
ncbi:von Willebrand factor type A domain-containing protein [Verrucomicrobiaceae bacterium E54]|nr:von Willebrand factor type A domain-containing protein [Verrucomicrobiaceae bacterium E54]